ncbi:hypothetical protein AGABI1DRAFT_133035 [Agaricus bisporus var. burnettii JB137-S8]|uniref:Ricin B lectin domain-containing protein n=1 Tax=Agaricus bisporus var. burnettii (strain JB137-S8 / ATCC MYA-4627 / FGSC 10392) TaxID=597362 RepID=K5WVR9_AGABU|nr:uncharacterized protein AGABI1DRAFT_133035 [Agaricus bisporus var. burnettii JB137-S8]EKM74637.1 hypothetical protein AGABI1DRAFT_133035 [Agaricus bisporus var. burnettii JB137-S8]
MFQGLNQVIVLTTLLLVGLGGLAAPTRRQSDYVRIRNADLDLCAAAFDVDVGTDVEFDDCERQRRHRFHDDEDDEDEYSQLWILEAGTLPGSNTMRPYWDDTLCAGITATDFSLKLQTCDGADPSDIDLFFETNLDLPGIDLGARGVCMTIDDNDNAVMAACVQGSNDQDIHSEAA